MTDVTIYVAVAENGIIGRDGGLPWRISSDLKRFKEKTMGKPVVMGRSTWAELGKALPGRMNIVITANPAFRAEGVEVVRSLEDGISLGKARARCMAGVDEICIIGGGKTFEQAMSLVDRLCITHVLASPEGDVSFPTIDPAVWTAVSEEDLPQGEKDDHPTRYVVYERRIPQPS